MPIFAIDNCKCSISRMCAVCKEHEYKDSQVSSGEFWICPDCCSFINRLKDSVVLHENTR